MYRNKHKRELREALVPTAVAATVAMLSSAEEEVRRKAAAFLEDLRIIPGADLHILGELARSLPHPLTALQPTALPSEVLGFLQKETRRRDSREISGGASRLGLQSEVRPAWLDSVEEEQTEVVRLLNDSGALSGFMTFGRLESDQHAGDPATSEIMHPVCRHAYFTSFFVLPSTFVPPRPPTSQS